MEVAVAIVGGLATVLAAILPPLIQHRPSAPAAFVAPPRWATRFFGFVGAILFGLAFVLALATSNPDAEISALAFIETLTLGTIAMVLSGFIGYRRKNTVLAVISYTVTVLGVLMLVHVLLSPHQTQEGYRDSLDFTPTGAYTFMLALLAGASGLAFLAAYSDSARKAGTQQPGHTPVPPAAQHETSTANPGPPADR